MAYTLVLVGGSGQRFGVVVGWLNVLGLLEPPSRVVIVDAEGAPGHPARLRTDPEYLLKFGAKTCKVVRYLPYSSSDQGLSQEPAARRAICAYELVQHMGSPFWDICLAPGPVEQQLDIRQGFYARPRLASTVFWNDVLRGRNSLDIQEMTQAAKAAEGHIVVIVGSLSGGTGAGLIPLITSLYRKKARPQGLYVVAFTKYFSTAGLHDAPDDELLRDNAANGARYFIDECLPNADAGFLIGVPENEKLPPPSDHVHLFPGFLAAASLLSNEGQDLHKWWGQRKQSGGSDTPNLVMLAVRNTSSYLQGDDVYFPFRQGPIVGGDDLYALAKAAMEEIAAFGRHSITACLGRFALFPRRRMTAALFDTMCEADYGLVLRTRADSIEKAIELHVGKATEALEKFREWLKATNTHLCKTSERVFFETNDESMRVVRPAWRDVIKAEKDFDQEDNVAECAAQRWIRQISKACAAPARLEAMRPDQLRWAFESRCDKAPEKLGFDLVPPALVDPLARIPAGSVRGESYPSPMGQAHAFAARLKGNDKDAIGVAQVLWRSLAMGWLTIENHDLSAPLTDFERVIFNAERHGFNRFLGVLRTSDIMVSDEQTGEERVLVSAGLAVGGTHPKCGLWPGVAADEIISTLAELTAGDDVREYTDAVLAAFYKSVLQEFTELDGVLRRVLEPIANLAEKKWPPVSEGDLCTASPLLVQFVWYDAGSAEERVPQMVYPFVVAPGRRHIRECLNALLVSGEVSMERGMDGTWEFKNSMNKVVARLSDRVPVDKKSSSPDYELAKFLGCGSLSIVSSIPLKSGGETAGSFPSEFEDACRKCREVFNDELKQPRMRKHRVPEFFWYQDLLPR